jgi:hypothetical protein
MQTVQYARSAFEQGEADVRGLSQSLMFLGLATAQPAAAGNVATSSHAAQSSASFVRSLGVVSHIDSGSAQWTNAPSLLNQLSYLGISNLRDGAPFDYALPIFVTLAQAGIRFNILEANVYSFDQTGQVNAALDVSRAHQLESAAPGSVISFEGSNEYTTNSYWLNGANSSGNLGWGLSDAQALEAAVRADPLFANTTIIAPSAIQLDSLPNFSDFVNASNVHIYGGPGEQLQYLIENSVNFARASVPGGPVYITETGISSAGYAAGNWSVTDELTQALINVNALLDGFSAGANMTFLYELMDEPDPWKSVPEQYFGLFRADGTPKPAATAIHNLTTILADAGTGAVPLGSLDYTVNWLPWSASTLLLEKSDGTFELVIWNGRAPVYENGAAVTVPTSTVNVTLGQTASSIRLFDPLMGTGAISSLQNASSVTFDLTSDPIIIEMKFAPPVPPSATNVLTSSGTSAAISGTADPGSRVSVFEGSKLLGTANADPAGHWMLAITTANLPQHSLTLSEVTVGGQTVSAKGVTLFGKIKQTLTGGVGDDVLVSTSGDRLMGGDGNDHFVINNVTGKQTVGDFHPGGDKLFIDDQLAAGFADLMSHARQSGTSVIIDFNSTSLLILEQLQLASLQASDITFF